MHARQFPENKKFAWNTISVISAVWLAAVVLCTIGQPFILGFYSDAWLIPAFAVQVAAPFSKALRFAYFLDPSRPGMVPLSLLFSSLFGDRVFLWHTGLLLANCLVALLLIRIIGLLTDESGKTKPAAIWIGACWMLLPWNVAAQFWPSMLSIVSLLVAFGGLFVLLIRGWSRNRHNAFLVGAIYFWICIGYEAFYFQWITLGLVGLALIQSRRARFREVAYSTAALIFAQLSAVLWHLYSKRLVAGGLIGVERPIVSDWPRILFGDLLTTIPSMFRSFGAARIPFAILALLLAAVWLANCYRSLRSPELRPAARTSLTRAAICMAGGLLSIFTFSLGGRGIDATGMSTRTLMLFNFWLVIAVGICVISLLERAGRSLRVAILATLASLGITLAAGHLLRLADWAEAWSLQTKILAEAPVDSLRQTPANARILFVNRPSVNGVPIFTAPWDLNSAMPYKYPFLMGRVFLVYRPKEGELTWDGQKLAYQGARPFETCPELYVWRPVERSLRKATGPIRVLRNLSVESLAPGKT